MSKNAQLSSSHDTQNYGGSTCMRSAIKHGNHHTDATSFKDANTCLSNRSIPIVESRGGGRLVRLRKNCWDVRWVSRAVVLRIADKMPAAYPGVVFGNPGLPIRPVGDNGTIRHNRNNFHDLRIHLLFALNSLCPALPPVLIRWKSVELHVWVEALLLVAADDATVPSITALRRWGRAAGVSWAGCAARVRLLHAPAEATSRSYPRLREQRSMLLANCSFVGRTQGGRMSYRQEAKSPDLTKDKL